VPWLWCPHTPDEQSAMAEAGLRATPIAVALIAGGRDAAAPDRACSSAYRLHDRRERRPGPEPSLSSGARRRSCESDQARELGARRSSLPRGTAVTRQCSSSSILITGRRSPGPLESGPEATAGRPGRGRVRPWFLTADWTARGRGQTEGAARAVSDFCRRRRGLGWRRDGGIGRADRASARRLTARGGESRAGARCRARPWWAISG
jgi:hypothetical protein